jgi:phosphoenolpyruvate carboxykinase (ATP)
MYHFLSGYTAKVAGTEVGVVEPQVTFSACFGAAFLVLHPARYAELLAEKIRRHHTHAWLVNTGWTAGRHGVGSRIKLAYTRAMIDAIHDGVLSGVPAVQDPRWNLAVPSACPGVPRELLDPRATWNDPEAYDRAAGQLALQFRENFARYASDAPDEVRQAGPRV